MIKALARFFKGIFAWFLGKSDKSCHGLDTDANVIQVKYNDIIQKRTSNIQEYKKAVALLVAQKELKTDKVQALREKLHEYESMKTETKDQAREIAFRMQEKGCSKEEIMRHHDYRQRQQEYNELTSKIVNALPLFNKLKADLDINKNEIEEHKLQIKRWGREIEIIKDEAEDSITGKLN